MGAALDIDTGQAQHRFGGRFRDGFRGWGLLEERATLGKLLAAGSVGEQAEVSDAHEA